MSKAVLNSRAILRLFLACVTPLQRMVQMGYYPVALTNDRMAEAMIRAGTSPATIASGERRRSQEARSMVSESDAPSRASQSGAVRVRWCIIRPHLLTRNHRARFVEERVRSLTLGRLNFRRRNADAPVSAPAAYPMAAIRSFASIIPPGTQFP